MEIFIRVTPASTHFEHLRQIVRALCVLLFLYFLGSLRTGGVQIVLHNRWQ
jgi:hypothetical protein